MMKTKISLLKSVTVLCGALLPFLFYTCSKDEPKQYPTCWDNIKNQNETGVDCGGICPFTCPSKMTAKINGVQWTADTTNIDVSYTSASKTLSITGRTANTFYPTITLVYVGNLTPGTYALNASTTYAKDISSFVTFDSGTITFNTIDTHDRLLNGSFAFTCHDSGGTIYTISEGIFEDLEY